MHASTTQDIQPAPGLLEDVIVRVSTLALSDLLGVLHWLCTVQLSKRR